MNWFQVYCCNAFTFKSFSGIAPSMRRTLQERCLLLRRTVSYHIYKIYTNELECNAFTKEAPSMRMTFPSQAESLRIFQSISIFIHPVTLFSFFIFIKYFISPCEDQLACTTLVWLITVINRYCLLITWNTLPVFDSGMNTTPETLCARWDRPGHCLAYLLLVQAWLPSLAWAGKSLF